MVEFALVLFPLLLLVAGIIQFGIAINFWQDQQRLAAAGRASRGGELRTGVVVHAHARAVPREPARSRTATSHRRRCASSRRPAATGTAADPGDSITVYLESPFKLVPIFGVGTITISARTTMRLEQKATHAGIAGSLVCS